jgi:acyl carrier protein
MGKVVDFVVEFRAADNAAVGADATAEQRADEVTGGNTITRAELFRKIVVLYAAALEYPEEVFTPDVELEAELGVDSVKQTELLGRLSAEYGLPSRPVDFRLANYDTLRKVTDFVFGALTENAAAGDPSSSQVTAVRPPALAPGPRPATLAVR